MGDVVWKITVVAVAAVLGGYEGFRLVAELTGLDDRAMSGERSPILALVVATSVGALVFGGFTALFLLRWS